MKSIASSKGKHKLSFLLIPIVLIGGYAIKTMLVSFAPKPPAKEYSERAWTVSHYTIDGTKTPSIVKLFGRIESPAAPNLSSSITAFVEQTYKLEGQSFTAGETILQLDTADARLLEQQRQADVSDLRSQLTEKKQLLPLVESAVTRQRHLVALNQKSLEREQQLQDKQLTSKSRLDSALEANEREQLNLEQQQQNLLRQHASITQLEARLKRAEALLEQAKLDIERASITVPFDGIVSTLQVARGDRVVPGQILVSVYDTSRLELRAQMPNKYIDLIKQQMKDQEVAATIIHDGTSLHLHRLSASVATGQGGIDAFFRAPVLNWPIGQTLEIELKLATDPNWLTVPRSAIFNNNRIYIIEDKRLHPVAITVEGNSYDSTGQPLALISGPESIAGATILSTQLPNAIDGLLVKTVSSAPTDSKKIESYP